MSKRVTVRNLDAVMTRFTKWVKDEPPASRKLLCADINDLLDNLLNQDAFGTEGQRDPRGDQRE